MQLEIEVLNGICGVDQSMFLLWIPEVGVEISPVDPLRLVDFGFFLSQRSPKVSRTFKAAYSSKAV